jgi:hypothetical protein
MRFIIWGLQRTKARCNGSRAGSDSSVIGLRHAKEGKSDEKSADLDRFANCSIERRGLKIPATGNPCVLTVGLSITITTCGE